MMNFVFQAIMVSITGKKKKKSFVFKLNFTIFKNEKNLID
jgi:hypothetical protein